jgi:hypothetical protein
VLECLRGYVSSSPYERSRSGGRVTRERRKGVDFVELSGMLVGDDCVLRLDELRVSRKDCDLRLSEGGRIASTVREKDIGL